MPERTGTDRFNEVLLRDLWSDFSNTRQLIKTLPGHESLRIFRKIAQDEQITRVLQKVKASLDRKPDQNTLDSLKDAFIGYFFEEYVFRLVQERIGLIGMDGVVLSPDQTIEFYRIIHPEASVVDSPNNLRMALPGISVPDGVVLEANEELTQIKAVCEYWVGERKPKKSYPEKRRQFERFNSGKTADDLLFGGSLEEDLDAYLQTIDPRLKKPYILDPDLMIICVFPQKTPSKDLLIRVDGSRGRVFVPFRSGEFKQVAEALVDDLGNLPFLVR